MANGAVYNLRDAYNVRNKVCWNAEFYELSALSHLPVSFAEARFMYKKASAIVNFRLLLKEWVNTNSEVFRAALRRLNEALTEENIASLKKIEKKTDPKLPVNDRLSEDQILVGIGVHLIKKLTGRAETSCRRSRIQCPCGCDGSLDSCRNMYIGSEDTFHGELDMLSLGVGLTTTERIPDYTETEEESMEAREFKKCVSSDESPGLIAQTITFGWTQYNRHSSFSQYIPTIYIDSVQFGVFVYNPVLDSLLITEYPILFFADPLKSLKDKYSGIFILWLILHHRLFFRENIAIENKGFDCKFKQQVKVEFYEELKEYSSCVKKRIPDPQWGPGGFGIEEEVEEDAPKEVKKRKHFDLA